MSFGFQVQVYYIHCIYYIVYSQLETVDDRNPVPIDTIQIVLNMSVLYTSTDVGNYSSTGTVSMMQYLYPASADGKQPKTKDLIGFLFESFSSWWFFPDPTHFKTYATVKLDHLPRDRGKNKKHLDVSEK